MYNLIKLPLIKVLTMKNEDALGTDLCNYNWIKNRNS